VDRQVAQELIKFKPDLPDLTRSVRVFLRRSVQLRAEAGLVELTRWLPDEPAGADPQRFAAYAGVGGNRPLVWCLFCSGDEDLILRPLGHGAAPARDTGLGPLTSRHQPAIRMQLSMSSQPDHHVARRLPPRR
jgi:hypothetical protein